MKKLISLVLAIMMVAVVGLAFADNGAITITNKSNPEDGTTTYEAYRIFDIAPAVDTDGNPITETDGTFQSVTYTIASKWTGFFATGAAGAAYLGTTASSATAPQIIVDGAIKYINVSESNVQAFAAAAFAYSQSAPVAADATNTTGTFTGLDYGYYMVYPKGASINEGTFTSIVSLTNANPSQEIRQKAKFPEIDKEDDQTDLELGGVVNYTITGEVPNTNGFTTYDYIVKDTMSNGLTFNDNIVVTIGEGTAAVTITDACTIVKTGIDETFTVQIPVMRYQEKVGQKITVAYSATINENAVVKSTLQEKNHAELVYSNDPKDNTNHTTTPPDETKVYTSNLVIDKYEDGTPTKKLAGAKFKLYKMVGTNKVYYKLNDADDAHETKYVTWVAEDQATEVETDEYGTASFQGLENGSYKLTETVAPSGYNKLTADVDVTIAGNDTEEIGVVATSTVPNNQGTELPSTGGIGTTIFYIVGGLLLVGAAIVLVARRKAQD